MLNDLIDAGLVRALDAAASGKAQAQFAIANRYVKGEPFPRRHRQEKEKEGEEESEDDEELCDFELERQKNIAANQALLRELGLA